MAFRAVHAHCGTVFAHLPDLGCGQSWEAVWKVRPPVPLACDECQHPMYAKVSRNGLRFFAHAPGAPTCALAVETLAHHLLKLELANAARDVGAHAEMEARGPAGTWRADVLASDPGGAWRMALEAQLAPITAADITARTERMRADGVPSIWFSDRPRPPWLGVVPSVRLARSGDGQQLVIAEGLVKFDGDWQAVPATLAEFLGWAFAERVVPHKPRVSLEGPALVWTAPHYIRTEGEYLASGGLEADIDRNLRLIEARLAAGRRPQERRREEIRRKNATSRATARSEAAAAEQALRAAGDRRAELTAKLIAQRSDVAQAIDLLAGKYGITATAGWSAGDPRYAGGTPLVDTDGAPAAIFNPEARLVRGKAFLLLAGTLLLFRTERRRDRFERAMRSTRYKPAGGWRTDFTGASQCTCTAPQLTVTINTRKYHAEPSGTQGLKVISAPAECEVCGGWYDGPTRFSPSSRA